MNKFPPDFWIHWLGGFLFGIAMTIAAMGLYNWLKSKYGF
jgi:hypothetical protein